MTKALIVVDVQNDFVSGSLAVRDSEEAAHRIGYVLPTDEYDIIALTQDWHINPGYANKGEASEGVHWSEDPDFKNTWPVHCKAHTWGAQVHQDVIDGFMERQIPERVRMATFHKGMYAAAYSGFEATENEYGGLLGDWLRDFGVTEVDIVGIATDYCVKATALDAVKEGFVTHVLTPYCAAVAPESNVAARAEMTEAGVKVEEIVA